MNADFKKNNTPNYMLKKRQKRFSTMFICINKINIHYNLQNRYLLKNAALREQIGYHNGFNIKFLSLFLKILTTLYL